jgi:hypothetical protein
MAIDERMRRLRARSSKKMIVTRSRPGLEMTTDRVFGHRVRRLIGITAVGLSMLAGLAYLDGAPLWALGVLGFGSLSVPFTLACSLRRPRARRALVVPAVAMPVGLVGVAMVASEATAAGWVIVLAGLAGGAFLGVWFWLRWIPVPWILDDPFGWPRVALVGVHIGLILAGGALIAAGL